MNFLFGCFVISEKFPLVVAVCSGQNTLSGGDRLASS